MQPKETPKSKIKIDDLDTVANLFSKGLKTYISATSQNTEAILKDISQYKGEISTESNEINSKIRSISFNNYNVMLLKA